MNYKTITFAGLFGAIIIGVVALTSAGDAGKEVNLYSYRQLFLMKPILNAFTDQTGIKVNMVYAKKGMLEKIKAAGSNNSADVVLTVDIGRLNELRKADLLEPVRSAILETNIPTHLRHHNGLWFGITTRARIALASRERVKPDELTSYADLAAPHFKGRVCMRSGKHPYNVALLASIIAHDGEAAAETWLRDLKSNLARKPQGNDRAQAKAIYEGVCDVALANNYYMGKMMTNERKPAQKQWAAAVRLVYMDQDGYGQHMNLSGAAVVRGAKNRNASVKLIEFLSGDFAQKLYAKQNHEYPVKPGVEASALVKSWGNFKKDELSIEAIAKYRPAASRLVDKVGFNDGPNS